MGAEIHHGGGDHAQIDHIDAGRLQAGGQGGGQFRAGQAAVAADDHAALALGGGGQAEGVADLAGHARFQDFTDDAANIVRFENGMGEGNHD